MNRLIHALETQLQLLEEFHALLSRETRELADINLDAMAEINERKESMAASIEANSVQLVSRLVETASAEGLPPKTTLRELAEYCNRRGKRRDISRLHEDLVRVTDRVRQAISINHEIAERFAASVSNSLDLLTRVINRTSTYGASGGYQHRPTGAVMINREA